MNVTLALTGSAADFINGTGMVEDPSGPDESLFRRYWVTRSERRFGRGYRVTLTAPAWVMNWIADSLEVLVGRGCDATASERKGAEKFISDVEAAGIRDAYDGPSRADLIEAGLMAPDEKTKVDVMEIQPRKGVETYRMRGTMTRASDVVRNWTRVINGKAFDFTRIAWQGGKGGYALTIRKGGTTTVLHNWDFTASGEHVAL